MTYKILRYVLFTLNMIFLIFGIFLLNEVFNKYTHPDINWVGEEQREILWEELFAGIYLVVSALVLIILVVRDHWLVDDIPLQKEVAVELLDYDLVHSEQDKSQILKKIRGFQPIKFWAFLIGLIYVIVSVLLFVYLLFLMPGGGSRQIFWTKVAILTGICLFPLLNGIGTIWYLLKYWKSSRSS